MWSVMVSIYNHSSRLIVSSIMRADKCFLDNILNRIQVTIMGVISRTYVSIHTIYNKYMCCRSCYEITILCCGVRRSYHMLPIVLCVLVGWVMLCGGDLPHGRV
jgi:hypothetical protein